MTDIKGIKSFHLGDDAKRELRELQNKLCIDGHLNKALDEIMRSQGVIGGADAVFNILGELVRTTLYIAKGYPPPDLEAEMSEAWKAFLNRPIERKEPHAEQPPAVRLL